VSIQPQIYNVTKVYGDGQETAIIVPIQYPIVQFRVRVGKGWCAEGYEFAEHNAPIRDHLDDIYSAIQQQFNLADLVSQYYSIPSTVKELEEWDEEFWDYGCRWHEEFPVTTPPGATHEAEDEKS